MTQEALKLALEALDSINSPLHVREIYKVGWAMKAIKEALAQHDSVQAKPEPEQEPVAWRWENGGEDKWLNKYIYLDNGAPDYPEECEPLYTTPPQRTWVGLTFAEICECENDYLHKFARAIEAKLKEKNNAA